MRMILIINKIGTVQLCQFFKISIELFYEMFIYFFKLDDLDNDES